MDDGDISFATGYLILKRRNESGIFHNLVLEMALGDRELYFKQVPDKLLPCICVNCIFYIYGLHLFYGYMRMSPESFNYLLNVVGPIISKEDTRFRKAIPSAERLCLTLHYLAYGGSQQSLNFSFRIAKSTVCFIINEKCKVIWDCLSEQYVQPPRTTDDWNVLPKILKTSGIYRIVLV